MKRKLLLANLLILFTAGFVITAYAQQGKQDVKTLLDSKHYSFVVQSVMPMGGPTRQVTTPYDMTVSPDKIDTYLPYFGKAYVAPMDPSQGGVDFVSTDFTYTPKPTKRGWEITIKPKDANDVRELILDVTTKGYATLHVSSNNRQAISYQGYIAEPQRKEHHATK